MNRCPSCGGRDGVIDYTNQMMVTCAARGVECEYREWLAAMWWDQQLAAIVQAALADG